MPAPVPAATWVARLLKLFAGLAIGLVVAEIAFYYRDDGAFPHLNTYIADPALGVRLMPGATTNIAFGGNPLTHVRINQAGYRGRSWSEPSGGLAAGTELGSPRTGSEEVLVVGDSQVFGLGVEESETFCAMLATLLHRPVMNGGVPTYGPDEYKAVIAEQLPQRHPTTVVLTLNLVNDFFEVVNPNKDRHAVWDGWAVRKETAAASTTWFPGRDYLFRKSHLFFAIRKWRHQDAASDERGVASEGTWLDMVASGKRATSEKESSLAARKRWLQEIAATSRQIKDTEAAINSRIVSVLQPTQETLQSARPRAQDIVGDAFPVEGSRPVRVTAADIATAVHVRAKLRKQLAQWAQEHATAEANLVKDTMAANDEALNKLAALDASTIEDMIAPPFAAHIRDVKALVESAGARLIVLVLPMDVQVSANEWKKYGNDSIDMEPSKVLTTEIIEFCRSIGVSALDATPVLASVEPGAFLDKDIHMTPKGHAAVAAALAKTIAEPPPEKAPQAILPAMPTPEMFDHSPEINVPGSTNAGCETKQVRQWLRVLCRVGRGVSVDAESERADDHVFVLQTPTHVAIMVALEKSKSHSINVIWRLKTQQLKIDWPVDAATAKIEFTAAQQNTLSSASHATSTPVMSIGSCFTRIQIRNSSGY
jgi:hypothetical protein